MYKLHVCKGKLPSVYHCLLNTRHFVRNYKSNTSENINNSTFSDAYRYMFSAHLFIFRRLNCCLILFSGEQRGHKFLERHFWLIIAFLLYVHVTKQGVPKLLVLQKCIFMCLCQRYKFLLYCIHEMYLF